MRAPPTVMLCPTWKGLLVLRRAHPHGDPHLPYEKSASGPRSSANLANATLCFAGGSDRISLPLQKLQNFAKTRSIVGPDKQRNPWRT